MAWTFFWTITVLHWYKKLENLLYLINENVLSHRGTGEALCKRDYSPCDCGTTCKYGILLAIVGFLQIMCFRAEKKSWFFPHISYILFPFIHFKSHFEIQGNKQFKSHLLPKCNWCSGKKKKKGSSLSCRADHIVLLQSCAASQGWALTGISYHVLGYTTGSGNPFIQWQ